MGLFNSNAGWAPTSAPAPTAADKLKPLSGMAPAPAPGLSADQSGILSQYANQQNSPYYKEWEQGIKSNKFAGTDSWFLDKFSEIKKGEDAIAKQAEIEKQLVQAGYGQQAQNVQSGMVGAGFGDSGFMGGEMQDLAANENLSVADVYNRMLSDQQGFRQGLEKGWKEDRYMAKQDNQNKRNRKMQIASTALAVGGSLLGGYLTPQKA